MIQRDQSLKDKWANPAPATTATAGGPDLTQSSAGAPSYENPPQPPPEEAVQSPSYETQPAPEQQQPVNVTYNNFYNTLAPYGNWVSVDGYGWCWQPNVVVINPGWQPYCNRGRWIYTDCGWYWMSDYSWGWTTFHYGRWFRHPRWGWCWWPDRVWAPAWVSWRYSDAYCGWAPLPPAACFGLGVGFTFNGGAVGIGFDFGLNADCYTFVPWGHVWDRHPYRHRLPYNDAKRIYNNTTIINNIAQGNDNTVVNRGIPTDRVERYTGRELHPVQIREIAASTPHGGRGESLGRDGQTVFVRRPQFQAGLHGNQPPAPARLVSTPSSFGIAGANRVGPATPPAQNSQDRDLSSRAGPLDSTRGGNPPQGEVRRDRQGASSSNESDRHAAVQNSAAISPPTDTAKQRTSQNSIVVIGRRDTTTPRAMSPWAASSSTHAETGSASAQDNPSRWVMNQNPRRSFTPPASVQTTTPTFTWIAPQTQKAEQQEILRVSRSIQNRDNSSQLYSSPAQQEVFSTTRYTPATESPVERPAYSAPRNIAPPSSHFDRSAPTVAASPAQSAEPRGNSSARMQSAPTPSPSPRASSNYQDSGRDLRQR